MGDIVKYLKKTIASTDFDMIVRRGYMLEDTLRRMNKMSFDRNKTITVSAFLS